MLIVLFDLFDLSTLCTIMIFPACSACTSSGVRAPASPVFHIRDFNRNTDDLFCFAEENELSDIKTCFLTKVLGGGLQVAVVLFPYPPS